MFHSNGQKSMKNFFRTLKTELVKKLFLLYPNLSTRSIFMLTHPALKLDPSQHQSFQVGNVSFFSILECSQKMKKICQLCIVNLVKSYPLYKLVNISSSVHHIRSKSFVITTQATVLPVGRKKKIVSPVLLIPSDHYSVH